MKSSILTLLAMRISGVVFKIKRFSPIDESFSVIGIDQWGNKSEPKIINVTVNLKSNDEQKMVEKLNPTKIKTRANNNKVALIIGIENYEQTPKATAFNTGVFGTREGVVVSLPHLACLIYVSYSPYLVT